MGRQDGLRPGDLVGAITNEAGLSGKQIGVIDVLDRSAFVEVPAAESARVVDALSNAKLRNRKVKVQLAQPAFGGSSEPTRPPRGDNFKKPKKFEKRR